MSSRIFVPQSPSFNEISIIGGDAHHMKNVLRLRQGDNVTVCFSDGSEYEAVISAVSDAVSLKIIKKLENNAELPSFVTLYQAYPKGDKLDLITQKCTELGVNRIVPVISERCVAKPDKKSAENKISRLSRIAESAAKQSGRSRIPKISLPISYNDAVAEIAKVDFGFICYEGGSTISLPNLLKDYKNGDISFFIGPEGGISFSEINIATDNSIKLAGLGQRILRTETAPIFVMSAISLLFC